MSNKPPIRFTVVGQMDVPHPGHYKDVYEHVDAANAALKQAGVPISLTNFAAVKMEEADFIKQEAMAEEMLLDWLSDAEIGEFSYIVLRNIDEVRARLRKLFGNEAVKNDLTVDDAFKYVQSARTYQARFCLWVHEAAVRRGRPPLGDVEIAAMQEDGDTVS